MSNIKKQKKVENNQTSQTQELEIKTIINIYNKAENLEYDELQHLIQNVYKKDLLNIVLKKIFENAKEVTEPMVNIIRTLTNQGVELDYQDEFSGNTFLMNACTRNWYEIAELIINKKPNLINVLNHKRKNCLFFAINSGSGLNKKNIDLIHLLLKNGVNLNHREKFYGDSCLSLALKQKNIQIAALLLQYGADPNINIGEDKNTPLHICCENLSKDLCNLLIINKANPFIKNTKNITAIDILSEKLESIDDKITEEYINVCSLKDNLEKLISDISVFNHNNPNSENINRSTTSNTLVEHEKDTLIKSNIKKIQETKTNNSDSKKHTTYTKNISYIKKLRDNYFKNYNLHNDEGSSNYRFSKKLIKDFMKNSKKNLNANVPCNLNNKCNEQNNTGHHLQQFPDLIEIPTSFMNLKNPKFIGENKNKNFEPPKGK
jgi:hypothetical protein